MAGHEHHDGQGQPGAAGEHLQHPLDDDHPHADRGHDSHRHIQDQGEQGTHDHDHGHGTGIKRFVQEIFQPHSHDAADSTDLALESSDEGIRALKLSLVALAGTAILQMGVVAITGSVALLADTIHNFSDALTALPLWVAFVLARRRPSRRYTYGYGRAEDLAGIFIVAMITLSAFLAGWESIKRFQDPQPLRNIGAVMAAGVIGFIGNELVARYRITVGNKIGSAALVADGLHARTDGFTSLAVVFGALGVMAGWTLADPIVGLLITVAILFVLRGAARDIYRRLMDAVDPATVDRARDVVLATNRVLNIEDLRMRWTGHRLRAEVAITVNDDVGTLTSGHAIAQRVRHRLLHEVPRLRDAAVHVSPPSRDGVDHHAETAHHFADEQAGGLSGE